MARTNRLDVWRFIVLVVSVASLRYLASVHLRLDCIADDNNCSSTLKASVSSKYALPTNSSLFQPEQLLEQYIAWHGEESLCRQPENRQFAVVYYNCPHRAGNALNAFFNSVIWAIVTNRTLLWRYDEKSARNTVADCDQVLERAAWIPSYEKWSANLSLPPPLPVKINTYWNWDHAKNMNQTWDFFSVEDQLERLMEPVLTPPKFRDFVHRDDFATSRIYWNDDPRQLTVMQPFYNYRYYKRSPHVASKLTRQLMKDLYSEGLSFLIGMLFHRTFRIRATDDLLQEEHVSKGGITIALHSRHAHAELDGTDVHDDIRCLDRLLPRLDESHRMDCIVYMMSDRQATLDILGDWVRQRGCRNFTAQHTSRIQDNGEFGWKTENGVHGGPVRFVYRVLFFKWLLGFLRCSLFPLRNSLDQFRGSLPI